MDRCTYEFPTGSKLCWVTGDSRKKLAFLTVDEDLAEISKLRYGENGRRGHTRDNMSEGVELS